ncbi:MAG: rhomboid family intramembrane serine protease [Flavobacteriales bacterium]
MSITETPITLVILAFTVLTSFAAFKDSELMRKMLLNPYLVKNHKEWYRTFSHALIHRDYIHLGFNMFVFFFFGKKLESIFTSAEKWNLYFRDIPYWGDTKGSIIYLTLYMGGLLFATLPALSKHSNNPRYNSLGASGATSAVLLAYIFLLPLADLGFLFLIPMKAFLAGALILIGESYMNKRGGTGIAHDAHLYGAAFGVVFILFANYRFFGNFIDQVSGYIGF